MKGQLLAGFGEADIIQNPKVYLPEGASGSADVNDIVFTNFTVNCSRIPIWIFVEEGIRLKRLGGADFFQFQDTQRFPLHHPGKFANHHPGCEFLKH